MAADALPIQRPAVISLGAGVQSSALLLMAARGEFDVIPDLAIFSDTGDEPKAVYEWLDFLRDEVKGTIRIETCERSSENGGLGGDTIAHAEGRLKSVPTPPLFVAGKEKTDTLGFPLPLVSGPIGRSCTRDYKVSPIKRKLKELGYGPKNPVEQWMGISLDEIVRMKRLKDGWQDLRYPLIEQRLTRHDCLLWMQRHGYPEPPRSACVFCPYHSNKHWRWMKDNTPDEFQEAVEFDRKIRRLPSLRNEAFLHRSLTPLDQVDLSTAEDHGQTSMNFGDECEGMCGV